MDGDATLQTFATGILAFRSAHSSLRPASFRDGVDHNGNGLKDITWLRGDGTEADSAYLANTTNAFLAFRVDGTETGDTPSSIYVAYNSAPASLTITLPSALKSWFIGSNSGSTLSTGGYVAPPGAEPALTGTSYMVGGRSVVIFVDRT
jgi:glycogen operon protein